MRISKKAQRAFRWIVLILKKNKIPFRISGGFAAKIYGSSRPLTDIDIELADTNFNYFLPQIKRYLIFGPKRCEYKCMRTYGLSLKYRGQIIDISGTETEELFDKKKKTWVKSRIDLSKVTRKKIFGLNVPVIMKKHLILYKRKIIRPVDKIDLAEIS